MGLRAAQRWGLPPLALLRPYHPQTWTDDDRTVALAYELYDASMCPCGCGFPRDRSWSGDLDGAYEIREHVCHARAARERWEEEQLKAREDEDAYHEYGILGEVIDITQP